MPVNRLAMAASVSGLMLTASVADARTRPVIVTAPAVSVTARVGFADLDLASAAGRQMLEHRVGVAVRFVCEGATNPSEIAIPAHYCRTAAWDGARPQMERAYARAAEIAATGSSAIAAAAIRVAAPE